MAYCILSGHNQTLPWESYIRYNGPIIHAEECQPALSDEIEGVLTDDNEGDIPEEREDSGSDGSKDDDPINPTHRCRCRRLPLACQVAHCASTFTGKTFRTKKLLRLHILCSHEPRTIVCARKDCQGSPKRFNELGYRRHNNKQHELYSFSGQVESSVPRELRL
jgi:hypothetical protein